MKTPAEYMEELGDADDDDGHQLSPTTTLEIDEVIRGIPYKGQFTYEVPCVGDQILIGQLKAKYLPEGGKADPNSAILVEQICYLEVCLKGQKPSWWTPMQFREADLIAILYAKGVAYANRFLGRGTGSDSAGQGDVTRHGNGDHSADEGDVEQDLPSPDKRPPVVISHAKRTS